MFERKRLPNPAGRTWRYGRSVLCGNGIGVLAYACIAYPKQEDEHLTKDSVRFHERLGYQMVGIFHQCGYKFETWYHVVWMEKCIEYLKYRNNEK
ncbi:MAG: GNAT family N-acetyltransferase [Lachnospiraceae bacterium]|nr:GNAT family N-acetyltransferase [Lachnospiraceae bacterium]